MGDSNAEPKTEARPRSRLRRWVWRCAWVLFISGLLGATAVGLLLTPAAGIVLRPKLEQELGVRAEGGTLKLDMGGDIIIRDVTFRTPEPSDETGPRGEASRFLTVKRGRILLGWRGRLRGGTLVRRVEIFDADVRLTKPLDDFDLNILAIDPPARSGPGGGPLPSILVHHASVLLGEHNSGGDITELRTLPIVASLRNSRETPGAFDVTAYEDPKLSSSSKPLRFEGSVGPEGFSGTLGGLDMVDFPPSTIPMQLRDVYEELQIGGRTRGATLKYDRQTDVLELVLDLQAGSPLPAPFAEDSDIDAHLDIRVPVPVDEAGTLKPLIPTSGSGRLRLVQRPPPESNRGVSWRGVQATAEPGEPGLGKRTFMIEGSLNSTIEDLSVHTDMRLWLGNAEPLYEFEIATLEPYAFSTDAPWLERPTPLIGKISNILGMFEPRGVISLSARAAQVSDGDTVRQEVDGRGTIRDGAMRFEYFPYPIVGVSGSIEIEDGAIRLVGLRGSTPAGTPVIASTTITLDEIATGVEVDAQAFGVPYDDILRQTLDDVAPEIREILLNESALAELYEWGVVRRPGTQGRVPAFALGGEADARVQVSRQTGVDNSTTVHVEVRSSSFGLLPEAFAVPILATDTLLTIDLPSELETTLMGRPRALRVAAREAQATTLAGGTATADVVVQVPLDEPPGQERATTVDVSVDAKDVPIHPALILAIPDDNGVDDDESQDDTAVPGGPRRMLRALGPRGDIDALVRITRDDQGDLDWWSEVRPNNVTLSPEPIETRRPLMIDDLGGMIRVDASGLRGELAGRPTTGGSVTANLRASFGDDSVLAIINSAGLDLRTPVEDVVAVFDLDLARSIAEARYTFDLRGTADVATSVRLAGDDVAAEVRIARADRVRFNWLDGRMGLDDTRGAIVVTTTDEGPMITLDRVLGEGSFEREPIGRLRLRGQIPLDALREIGSQVTRATTVDIEVQGGQLESKLLRTLARNRSASDSGSLLDRWDLHGEYDAMVALHTAAYPGTGSGVRPIRAFELSPYDASFVRDGQRYNVPWVSGVISGRERTPSAQGPGGVSEYTGHVDYLTLGGDQWWVSLDGFWRSEGGQRSEFEVALDGMIDQAVGDANGPGLPEPILGLMPQGVGRALEAMDAQSHKQALVNTGRLRVVTSDDDETRIEFDAELGVEELSLGSRADSDDPQTPRERSIATFERMAMAIRSDTDHPRLHAAIDFSADSGRVWGLGVRDATLRADVRRDDIVDLSDIGAEAGGGRLAGRGRITLAQTEGQRASYTLDLAGSGLETARLLSALRDEPIEETRGAGDLDLSLGMSGQFGAPDELRGRGAFRIRGGAPVELPLAIRAAVEAMNVKFGADRYDAMNGDFYIHDQTLTFTRLAVSSDSVILDGLGTVDLQSNELDMSITTRPIQDTYWQALFRALREVIVAVDLRGTLDQPAPAPKPQALVGPLDRLRRMIQGGQTYEEWTKERLRRYARQRGVPESGW
ncbi:MAG: AsmA-like C-terminal region-containing protein [Phycisphaerales bacterium JB060]